jgi:hypothetical protein
MDRTEARRMDAAQTRPRAHAAAPRTGTLVAHRYGRRDWFLRRLLVVVDVVCLAAAILAFAGLATALVPARRGELSSRLSWRGCSV